MEIFKVSKKEMDHVKKEKELKSTNSIKVNKRIRKQKDIIMKLIDNLPNQLTDIPIACIKGRKYGHHVTECGKKEKEKEKKEKTKNKQDRIEIKLVTLHDLMTEAKMVKQEIKEFKEDNLIDINEQCIAKIINLKELSKPMIDPLH